jgi:hypothetical protein
MPWRVTTRRGDDRIPWLLPAPDGAGLRNGEAGTDRCVGQRFLMMSERIGRMVKTEKTAALRWAVYFIDMW